jgi:hypothetical protein
MTAMAISSSKRVYSSRDSSKEAIDLLTTLMRYSKSFSSTITVWLSPSIMSLPREELFLALLLED